MLSVDRLVRRFRDRITQARQVRRRRSAWQAEALEVRTLLTTFLVTNTNDSGAGSLRQAIDDANALIGADQVRFNANLTGQTITLTTGELQITESVEIRGPSFDAAGIIISGNQASRVFQVTGSAADVTLRYLSVVDGMTAGDGGGLLQRGQNTTIIDSRISNNRGSFGGAISNSNNGTLTILRSSIVNNFGNNDGGGIDNFTGGVLTIRDSTIANNSGGGNGGGIVNEAGATSLTVINSTISDNHAISGEGGGIANFATTSTAMTVHNTTIAGNTSIGGGGGLSSAAGTVSLINVTVADNYDFSTNVGDGAGGVSRTGGGTIMAVNVIVSQNISASGNDNTNPGAFNGAGTQANFIGGDPRLGPLQDNGGRTFTMELLPTSAAIDGGVNTVPQAAGLAVDQRGSTRIVDGDGDGTAEVDMGAFEYNPGPDIPIVTGADAGQQPRITLMNSDGSVRWSKFAFNPSFTGGVSVALGDITGDGVPDVIAGEGPGGQSRFRVFNGVDGTLIAGRAPFSPSYSGGIFVATGDFDNDGVDDIASATRGTQLSRVRVRSGANVDFNIWNMRVASGNERDPVRIAAGDVNNDGFVDLITARLAEVKVFDGSAKAFMPPVLHQFTPFGAGYPDQMFVASGNLDGDGNDDIIVSRGDGQQALIRLYSGGTGAAGGTPDILQTLLTSDPNAVTGARVAARDIDGDGLAEIITANGPGAAPIIRTFWSDTGYSTFDAITDFYLADHDDGIFVAVG